MPALLPPITTSCPESKVRYTNAVILSERSESKDLHFQQDGYTSVSRKCASNFEFTTLERSLLLGHQEGQ
jgi:hypothetical protein